jgi:RNA polymerase sigma-70 factor (ECF subfamily)
MIEPNPENRLAQLFYNREGAGTAMSSESARLVLPFGHLVTGPCEVTSLYRELRHPLLRYLVCLGLSADEAQDVVQDAFLALHQHVTAGGSKENVRGWVFRVAHNRARNRQKSYNRRFASGLDAEAMSMAHEVTPERTAIEKERSRQLKEAIDGLSDSERACLLLRAEGLRYREIGDALDIPTSTVSDIVDRAIKKLAERCHG